MPRFYQPDLGSEPDSPFARDANDKLDLTPGPGFQKLGLKPGLGPNPGASSERIETRASIRHQSPTLLNIVQR